MQFYNTFRMRTIDKNKNIKTTKTKTLSFVQLWPNFERGENNGSACLPVIKFNLFNKTSSFLIALKFRKSYIQILNIVWKQGHLQEDRNAHALSTMCSVQWDKGWSLILK